MSGKKRAAYGNKNSGTAAMSLAEIGRMFGVSLQSIQAVEQRAIKKIRTAIEQGAKAEGMSIGEYLFGDDDKLTAVERAKVSRSLSMFLIAADEF